MASADLQLQQLFNAALREAGKLSALQKDLVCSDIELRYRHPGEYVAYIDRYKVQNRNCRLVREILACSSNLADVKASFSGFGSKKRARVRLEFLEPLGDDLETHNDLPLR
jgi:hypothetical protein